MLLRSSNTLKMVYMWSSLKESCNYTTIQKVLGRSPINILVVTSNSIQSLHICQWSLVIQPATTHNHWAESNYWKAATTLTTLQGQQNLGTEWDFV